MKPTDRTRALNAAAVDLAWLCADATIHGPRLTAALAELARLDARATIAAGSGDGTGRRSIGGHSDPTSVAAGSRLDVAIECRRQVRQIERTAATVIESARWLRCVVADLERTIHPGLEVHDALADVEWLLMIPHAIGAWTTDDGELAAEVDHACDHLARQTRVLVGQVTAALRGAVRERERVVQRKRVNCASCRRFGIDADVDQARPSAGLCLKCRSFRRNHGVMPTEAVCRLWAAGSERITPGMVIEAKAAARGRRRSA